MDEKPDFSDVDPVDLDDSVSEDERIFEMLNSEATPLDDLAAEDEVEVEDPLQAEPGEGGEPPFAPSPIESADLAAIWRDTYGSDPTPEAVVQNFQVAQQLAQLSPQQRAQLEQVLAGTYQPPPVAPVQAPVEQPPALAPPQIQLPDYVDEDTRKAFEQQQAYNQQLAAQVTEFSQWQTQQEQAQQEFIQERMAQQNAQMQQAAAEAKAEFSEAYPTLTEGEVARILHTAGSNPAYQAIYQQTGGDVKATARALLDMALFTHSDIKDRVERERIQAAADVAVNDSRRKQRASAVSGGGKSAKGAPVDSKTAAVEAIASGELGTF